MAHNKTKLEISKTLKDYIDDKAHILKDFGMNNTRAIKSYFESKIADLATDEKKEIKIDRLARDMIESYFNGDHTFVRTTL